MIDYPQIVTFLLTSVCTALTVIASLTWWLSKQFSNNRDLFYNKIDAMENSIVSKLEYHERHDDTRFNAITNDLWELRLRNAVLDGSSKPLPPTPRVTPKNG